MKDALLEIHKSIQLIAIMNDEELLQAAEVAYSLSSRITAEVLERGICIEFFPMNVSRNRGKQ